MLKVSMHIVYTMYVGIANGSQGVKASGLENMCHSGSSGPGKTERDETKTSESRVDVSE